MVVRMLLVGIVIILTTNCRQTLSSSRIKEVWNQENNPLQFEGLIKEKKFSNLPLSGSLAKKPWSGHYWRAIDTGLAFRWQRGDDDETKNYPTLTVDELSDMPAEELATLSPAEKFAIYSGDLSFKFVDWERSRTRPSKESWEGICHGWASAAINYAEPKPFVTDISLGGETVSLKFASSDVKALLSYFQAIHAREQAFGLGERCRAYVETVADQNEAGTACTDTNAGAFHLLMTNRIGIEKKGFVIDVEESSQVWNQPVYAYKATVGKSIEKDFVSPAPGTVKQTEITVQLDYVVETHPDTEPVETALKSKTYQYRIDLDSKDEIIGGSWISFERPDYITMRQRPGDYIVRHKKHPDRIISTYWEKIGELYKLSQQN